MIPQQLLTSVPRIPEGQETNEANKAEGNFNSVFHVISCPQGGQCRCGSVELNGCFSKTASLDWED